MKKGVTLVSLVLYVALFFTFTVFATALTTNLNHKVLSEKGRIITNENVIKLYSNILSSAKNSNFYDILPNKIVFSNGDYYDFDEEKNCIYRNSGKLVENVEKFIVNPVNRENINNLKCFEIDVEFKKYNETLNKKLIITVGDEVYE